MRTEALESALTVVGLPLRTSNEAAATTIPPHWEAFSTAGGTEQVPGRLSEDVFAVYTDFEHEGVSNSGYYTLVIGCRVAHDAAPPASLVRVVVPASDRVVFPVAAGRSDLVGAAWQEIWARTDLPKTFVADYERYAPDGGIEISIGVTTPQ
ncbi:GyrI-like domain-containing protein [Herbiconiux ginsengi]|uniref:Predicted transcriptional regulator YdeE, contains AraC-type DNA-binding domain n=1 Tax=Herbiconiux ginsengi TaxID=381665 RepID=A0A1H3RTN4_9MICO|nr:effector binding domain-containing protein [Herbiconiux ginsengi]SDZ29067.1 Predicted transcriptional regulator YdeE, contains AraC-type DNA-binding domain [Herbiconiux ginsengi]